ALARDLHRRRRREQAGADAIEARHHARRLHADRRELGDMVLDRGAVPAGPAGDHEPIDAQRARYAADAERELVHGYIPPQPYEEKSPSVPERSGCTRSSPVKDP